MGEVCESFVCGHSHVPVVDKSHHATVLSNMENKVASVVAVDQHRGSNGQCLGKKVLEFHGEGHGVQTCGQHYEMGGADPATCHVDHSVVHPTFEKVAVLPLSASKTQSCYTMKECEPGASHREPPTTRESVVPSETNECVSVANGADNTSVHQFFLPSDDEVESTGLEPCVELNGQTEESTAPLGLEPGKFREAPVPRIATAPAKAGVKFCGSHHVFTVVPVGSGELWSDDKGPQTCATITEAGGGTDSKQVPSTKSQMLPACIRYSPYNTVKASPVGHRLAYSPYQTITRREQVPAAYNPYHTIAGFEPTSYQRSESGLRRVVTSRREYGVGGSSIPPSLMNVAFSPFAGASQFSSKVSLGAAGAPIPPGLHRVRTLPCPATGTLRVFPEEPAQPSPGGSDGHLPLEQATIDSINQMTVRSAGGLSIDVGSTDGRNVKIHGAVESPEQLPLLPSSLG